MGKTKTRERFANDINAGSMADIAFLLLFFFLVTTTILEDKGILVKLPPWSDEPPEMIELLSRNVFSVLVNASNQLLVRGELLAVENLRARTKEFILNPQRRDDLAQSPSNAIISLKNDRGTSYATYLTVYNELQAAYNELRNETAQKRFGKEYAYLTVEQKKQIRDEIPLVISEAEPTSHGVE